MDVVKISASWDVWKPPDRCRESNGHVPGGARHRPLGQEVVHALLEAGRAGVFLGPALIPAMPRRFKGLLVSAGLVWTSVG